MTEDLIKEFRVINKVFNTTLYPSPIKYFSSKEGNFAIKNDDLLQLGCSKQRSIIYMIAKYIQTGKTQFTVSSSGNAALVAAFAVLKQPETSLKIFLSVHISDEKLKKFIDLLKISTTIGNLRNGGVFGNIEIDLSDNPKQKAIMQANNGWLNLRGSKDDTALIGFRTISYELMDINDRWDAVFVPASSGSTALGIYQGFQESGQNPAMHIVQTTKVNTLVKRIAKPVDDHVLQAHPSESIVDIIGLRRLQIEEMVKKSNGAGWIISTYEVEQAKSELDSMGMAASYDSALTFAAFKKSTKTKKYRNPVMIFTG